MTELHQALDALNAQYESIHTAKEDAFWRSMMGLGGDPERNRHEAERLHVELQRFLSDAEPSGLKAATLIGTVLPRTCIATVGCRCSPQARCCSAAHREHSLSFPTP